MQVELAIYAGVGVSTAASAFAVYLKNRKAKRLARKQAKKSEDFKKNREMYASFRYRDAFKIQQIDEVELSPKSNIKFQPKEEQQLLQISIDDFDQAKDNLRCPLSGKILKDPVTLNGHVYEREAIEDFLFENDWFDPAVIFEEENKQNVELTIGGEIASPNDIMEASDELQELIKQFHEQYEDKIPQIDEFSENGESVLND